MKRRQIILAVDLCMAENGYSRGYYAWERATLRVWPMHSGGQEYKIHLPAGRTSKKRFMERMSVLPVAGPPRPIVNFSAGAMDDGYRQRDMGEVWHDAR